MIRAVQAMLLLITTAVLAGCFAAAVGTGAAVVHDRRSLGTVLDDQAIEIRVTDALHRGNAPGRGNHIKVTSFNRTVLLVGEVASQEDLEKAQTIVLSMNGIDRVINELSIGQPEGLATRSRDTILTGQVKSVLLATRGVDPTRFNLTSHRGVVYMMGLVTPDEADKAAARAARVAGVRSVVKVLDYIEPETPEDA